VPAVARASAVAAAAPADDAGPLPGLEQHLPMVLAGVGGEGGGHHQHLGSGGSQVAVELREADVVTN
jgi:hypothetical protein